jgi:alpha-tubulin suppressor-like RCC1 family protein
MTIAASWYHTCAITSGGALQCWGQNDYGQLGDGTTTHRLSPVTVSGLSSGVVAVGVGDFHTCAVTQGGALWCWGRNDSSQLGDGTWTGRLTPVPVSGLRGGVVGVAGGWGHTCAVTSAGAALCWGENWSGQLGDGTTDYKATPVPVMGLGSGVVAVAGGGFRSCALTSGGAALCWGANAHGEVGDGTTTNRRTPVSVAGLDRGVVAIAAAVQHACAVTNFGTVLCWGWNEYGRLGDGTTTMRLAPVPVTGLSDAVGVTVGSLSHSCALMSSGTVQCWGSNGGALADGTTTERLTPVAAIGLGSGLVGLAAGNFYTCALSGTGVVRCGGDNSFGELGDGTRNRRLIPTRTLGYGPVEHGDFDGDEKADPAVFRQSSGAWYQLRSRTGAATGVVWGAVGDTPVPADYDGDCLTDVAVFRPTLGMWFILHSSTGGAVGIPWGRAGDVPLPADYDGDGKADVALFRPSTGTWFIVGSRSNTASGVPWGQQGDVPVPADYDGDGRTDVAVFRPATGTWYIVNSATNTVVGVPWGQAGDQPVPADYDGDGKADPTVFRPATGAWYQWRSATGTTFGFVWGQFGDQPVASDYDGDGKADPTVFRSATGTWLQVGSTSGVFGFLWGVAGDLPL